MGNPSLTSRNGCRQGPCYSNHPDTLPGNILETQNLMPLYGLATLWNLHFNKIPEGLISSINLRIIGVSKIKPNTQKSNTSENYYLLST